MPHVELLTLPEHPISTTVFSVVRVAQSVVFCVMFCRSFFVLLAIVLSVLLRFTTSDYPFGTFNHFFSVLLKEYWYIHVYTSCITTYELLRAMYSKHHLDFFHIFRE